MRQSPTRSSGVGRFRVLTAAPLGGVVLVSLVLGGNARAQLVVANANGTTAVSPLKLIDVSVGGLRSRDLTAGNVAFSGLAADNAGGRLFAVDAGPGGERVLWVYPMADSGPLGAPALVPLTSGGFSISTSIPALAWDSRDNVLVGPFQSLGWILARIDPQSGQTTVVGSGFTTSSIPTALDYDAGTDAFYVVRNSTSTGAPFTSGRGLYRINKPLSAATYTFLSAFPAGETEIDGLAAGNGRLYLVNDTGAEAIHVYNLTTNAYEASVANPLGAGTVAGGAWAPALLLPTVTRLVAEAEPNETKTTATCAIPLAAGEGLGGITTGSSTTAPGAASADSFLVGSPRAAPEIYRRRLDLYSATPGHTCTIRGLQQSAGVINQSFDSTAQTGVALADGGRRNQWYDFGGRGQVYYRVAGSAATSEEYRAVHSITLVTPTDLGAFAGTQLTLSKAGVDSWDLDFWVYDENFTALPGFGHDDNDGAGLTRDFAPGSYYLALGRFNLGNDQASPPDDTFRSGGVADFPGVVWSSSTTSSGSTTFRITTAAGALDTVVIQTEALQVHWYRFTVVQPCNTDFDGSGVTDPDDLSDYITAYFNGCR